MEVIGLVFFSNNIFTAGPGTTDLRSKVLNFCLDFRPPDPIGPSFKLLPLLLELDNSGIRGECYKNVIRYVYWYVRITYEAYMGEYIEDAICGGPFEDGR